jgi:CubicO group peptidase (beta-lactamase class C family)
VPGQPPRDPEFYTIPANRDITIRDLLTHTSGLASGGVTAREVAKLLQARKPTDTLADFIPRLAALPLDFQPGTMWRYSGLAGFDTLGRVVEIVSGLAFDQFLRQRMFEPLGMKDTFFSVPEDRLPRLVTLYRKTPEGLRKSENQRALTSRTYFSGAGGLISTGEDFLRFGQMLLNGGALDGQRLLGPRTVELMMSNNVGDLFNGQIRRPPQGMGFGLGGEVVLDTVASGIRRPNGSYGWDGAFGTHFWVAPKEQLVAVLMIQTPSSVVQRDYENAVMQDIVE